MPANSTPLLRTGRTAAANLPAYCPIRNDGSAASVGDPIVGITESSVKAGQRVSVVVNGSAEAWAGGSIQDGALVQVGPSNTIVTATSGSVVGRAMNAATSGDKVEVLLFCNTAISTGTAAYLGQIANRCSVPNQFNATLKQGMARSKHFASDTINALALVYANWWVRRTVTVGEVDAGSSATFTAAIEYPSGTIAAVVTFGGQTSGTVADGGTLQSDLTPLPVTIPQGAAFFVRTWMSCAAGLPHYFGGGLATATGLNNSGESFVFSATTQADTTQTPGNFANQSANYFYRPAAIIGYTSRPSFFIAGDSRLGNGVNNDAVVDGYGLTGEIDKALGRIVGTINAGCGGERLQNVASTGYTRRSTLIQYASHAVCEYGINDIANLDAGGARSSAQVQADLATFAARFGNKPLYASTLSPVSTSTDSWATTANQTTSGNNSVRLTYNAWVRTCPPPLAGYFEVADQTESARDSGIWKAGFTADGIHGNAAATSAIQSSGAVRPIGV